MNEGIDEMLKWNQYDINSGISSNTTKYKIINDLYQKRLNIAIEKGDTCKANKIRKKISNFQKLNPNKDAPPLTEHHKMISDQLKRILFTIRTVPICTQIRESALSNDLIDTFGGFGDDEDANQAEFESRSSSWEKRCQEQIVDVNASLWASPIQQLINFILNNQSLSTSIGIKYFAQTLRHTGLLDFLKKWGVDLGAPNLNNDTNVGQPLVDIIGELVKIFSLYDYGMTDVSTKLTDNAFFKTPGGYKGSKVVYGEEKVNWILLKDIESNGQLVLYATSPVKKEKISPIKKFIKRFGVSKPSNDKVGMELSIVHELNENVTIYVWRNCFELFTTIFDEEYVILPPDSEGNIVFIPRRIAQLQTDQTFSRWYIKHLYSSKNDESSGLFGNILNRKKVDKPRPDAFEVTTIDKFGGSGFAHEILRLFESTIQAAIRMADPNKTVRNPKSSGPIMTVFKDDTDYDMDLHDWETNVSLVNNVGVLFYNLKYSHSISDVYVLKKFIDTHCPEYNDPLITDDERLTYLSMKNIIECQNGLKTIILSLLTGIYGSLYTGEYSLTGFATIKLINWVIGSLSTIDTILKYLMPNSICLNRTIAELNKLVALFANMKTKDCTTPKVNKEGCKMNNIRDMRALFNRIDNLLNVFDKELRACSVTFADRSFPSKLKPDLIRKTWLSLSALSNLNYRYYLLNKIRRVLSVMADVIDPSSGSVTDTQLINRNMNLVHIDKQQTIEIGDLIEIDHQNNIIEVTVTKDYFNGTYDVKQEDGNIIAGVVPYNTLHNKRHVYNDIIGILEIFESGLEELAKIDPSIDETLKNIIFQLEFNLRSLGITLVDTPLFKNAIQMFNIQIDTTDEGIFINPKFKIPKAEDFEEKETKKKEADVWLKSQKR